MIRLEAPSVTELQNALGASFLSASRAAIFTGGEPSLPSNLAPCDIIIAVDSGLSLCEKAGLKPNLILGDMDSVDPAVLARFPDVPVAVYPRDKDKSDLELACEIFTISTCYLCIYGALGGRTDHLLSNLAVVAKFPRPCGLFSAQESILRLSPGLSTIEIGEPGSTLSLFSLSCAKNVQTKGLFWEIVNRDIDISWFSLSNRNASDSIVVAYDSGRLFAIIQNK